jgi:hypothetical protein
MEVSFLHEFMYFFIKPEVSCAEYDADLRVRHVLAVAFRLAPIKLGPG